MSMEGGQNFRPGAEHKQVSDLPEDQQNKYVDLPKGGFVTKETFDLNKSHELLAEAFNDENSMFDKIINKIKGKDRTALDVAHRYANYDNNDIDDIEYSKKRINDMNDNIININSYVDKTDSAKQIANYAESLEELSPDRIRNESLVDKRIDELYNKYVDNFKKLELKVKEKWINLCKDKEDFATFFSKYWALGYSLGNKDVYINSIDNKILDKWFNLCENNNDLEEMIKILEKRNAMGFIYEKLLESKK